MTREKIPTIFERFQILMEDEMGPGKVYDTFLTSLRVVICIKFIANLSLALSLSS